jgi:hypothetical protein
MGFVCFAFSRLIKFQMTQNHFLWFYNNHTSPTMDCSQPGAILPSRGHLITFGDILGCHTWGERVGEAHMSRVESRRLLDNLKYPGQSHTPPS